MTRKLLPLISAKDLARKVDEETFCICFFGGDPTPQFPHALAVSKIIARKNPRVRICFETNGTMSASHAREMAKVSFKSKGVINSI